MFKFYFKLFLYGLVVSFLELLTKPSMTYGVYEYILERIGTSLSFILFSSIIAGFVYLILFYWKLKKFDVELFKKNITYVWVFVVILTIMSYFIVK